MHENYQTTRATHDSATTRRRDGRRCWLAHWRSHALVLSYLADQRQIGGYVTDTGWTAVRRAHSPVWFANCRLESRRSTRLGHSRDRTSRPGVHSGPPHLAT